MVFPRRLVDFAYGSLLEVVDSTYGFHSLLISKNGTTSRLHREFDRWHRNAKRFVTRSFRKQKLLRLIENLRDAFGSPDCSINQRHNDGRNDSRK